MNRIFVSIDVSNLYYTVKKRFGDNRKIDYRKLQKYCREKGWVYRSIAYASEMQGKAEEFFNCLKTIGYEVRLKPVKEYKNKGITVHKANVDIEMVIDIVKYLTHYDELVLISSDGDMIPMVKYCQERGIKVHVLGCALNSDLREAADSWTEIGPALLERTSDHNNEVKSA